MAGNIRELENMIERTAVMANGPLIASEDLLPALQQPACPVGSSQVESVSMPVQNTAAIPNCGEMAKTTTF